MGICCPVWKWPRYEYFGNYVFFLHGFCRFAKFFLIGWKLSELQVADLIAFVASTNSLYEENASDFGYIDSFGSQCLSVFRQLGLPNTVVFLRVRS